MIKVIKIGGNIVDNPVKLNQFIIDFNKIPGDKILVHGGGKIASEISASLGIKVQMIEGKRATDAETLKVVTMVYAGLINKNIVAKLQAAGTNAIGLTGADANLIPATKRADALIDWGYVGDVNTEQVAVGSLQKLLEAGLQPVFCAITHDGKGNLLNTNADTIASSLAAALAKTGQKVSLVYCFEKKGVLEDINNENTLIKLITPAYYQELKEKNIVNKGMIPKLDNAFISLAEGVYEVKICMAEDLSEFEKAGTSVRIE